VATVSTIGLDIAKHIFQAHDADASGQAVFRKKVTRTELIDFLASQPRCLVALEACDGSHYWRREISKLRHTVRAHTAILCQAVREATEERRG
jgi:transposase